MLDMLKSLLRSRKFWLAVIAVIAIILGDGLGLDPAIVEGIVQVLMILAGLIAAEDIAAKIAARK